MSEQLFSLPIDVTAYRFDRRGKSLPARITWNGVSIHLDVTEEKNGLSFHSGGRYYWLERKGKSWHIARRVYIN